MVSVVTRVKRREDEWFAVDIEGRRFNWSLGGEPIAAALDAAGGDDVLLIVEGSDDGEIWIVAVEDALTGVDLWVTEGDDRQEIGEKWLAEATEALADAEAEAATRRWW